MNKTIVRDKKYNASNHTNTHTHIPLTSHREERGGERKVYKKPTSLIIGQDECHSQSVYQVYVLDY